MLARRTVGSKFRREAPCALWLAEFPAEENQGRLEGPEAMPPAKGHTQARPSLALPLAPSVWGGPGSLLKHGRAGRTGTPGRQRAVERTLPWAHLYPQGPVATASASRSEGHTLGALCPEKGQLTRRLYLDFHDHGDRDSRGAKLTGHSGSMLCPHGSYRHWVLAL